MLALIAVWALAEGILFFIVADVPITALGLRAGWRPALLGGLIASVFAAVGGSIVWFWATQSPENLMDIMLATPAINEELVDYAAEEWTKSGPLGMLVGSFSGVPYKLYAIAAGKTSGPEPLGLGLFFLASICARLPRFALVAVASGVIGQWLIQRLGARLVWAGYALGWITIYAAYWSSNGF